MEGVANQGKSVLPIYVSALHFNPPPSAKAGVKLKLFMLA
jgi:hypothetical protein